MGTSRLFSTVVFTSIASMKKVLIISAAAAIAPLCFGQMNSPQAELAGLREDVRGLVQRVGDLQVRVEQLEKENTALRERVVASQDAVVTLRQLNDAVSDINRRIQSSISASEDKTMRQVQQQLEAMSRQMNSALAAVSRNAGASQSVQAPTFSKDFPQNGVYYTVRSGDNLSSIARRFGVTMDDIVNANQIADRNSLTVGQPLFLPGAKGESQ